MERWAGKARDAFVAVAGMQPRVVVNERVVFEQSSPVLELAVLEREASVERETENTWLGSTKHLRVRGLYRIKAGYDLRRPFTIRLDGADAADGAFANAARPGVERRTRKARRAVRGQRPVEPRAARRIRAGGGCVEPGRPAKGARRGHVGDAEKSFSAQLQDKLGSEHRLEIVNDPPPEPLRKQ